MNESIEKLRLLSEIRGNWCLVAKTLTETISNSSWKKGQADLREWMTDAAQATEVSTNTLTRWVATYKFLIKLVPQESIEKYPMNYPFSSLEILKRIHKINPMITLGLLNSISRKRITMRELRKKLDKLQAEQPAGIKNTSSAAMRSIAEFERLAFRTIRRSLPEFHLPESYKVKALSLRTTRIINLNNDIPIPDVIAYKSKLTNNEIIGFEINYLGEKLLNILRHGRRLIERCCYLSSFVDKLYLILPSEISKTDAQKIADTFIATGRLNIGVALLNSEASIPSSDGNFIFLSRPVDMALPTPDCRTIARWESIAT